MKRTILIKGAMVLALAVMAAGYARSYNVVGTPISDAEAVRLTGGDSSCGNWDNNKCEGSGSCASTQEKRYESCNDLTCMYFEGNQTRCEGSMACAQCYNTQDWLCTSK